MTLEEVERGGGFLPKISVFSPGAGHCRFRQSCQRLPALRQRNSILTVKPGKHVCVVIPRAGFPDGHWAPQHHGDPSQGKAMEGKQGCCTFCREARGAVWWASSQHLLQDDANAEDVCFEGAPPRRPWRPQQLRSCPQQLCSHRAGPHCPHPLTSKLGRDGWALDTYGVLAQEDVGASVLPIPRQGA